MDEQKLIKLLEKHFPTKPEFIGLKGEVSNLGNEVGSLKMEVGGLKKEFGGMRQEFNQLSNEVGSLRKDMVNGFQEINEKLYELTSSAKALDKILEQHPIERIKRLEKHAHLPAFTTNSK
jgi:archaellum component FlaC